MKKIPTLFVRNPDDMRYVTEAVNPGCEWVLAGEGVATRKYDGTCMMLDTEGRWWARREVKPGKTPPPNWVEADRDGTTGKRPGWEPAEQSAFAKFWREAMDDDEPLIFGTYELCGPKINRNPEGYDSHRLVSHEHAEVVDLFAHPGMAADYVTGAVRSLGHRGWEGIVWHHPDGRMAKLKARDLPTTASEGERDE